MTEQRYCRQCGNTTQVSQPAGQLQARELCPSCGTVYYENPKVLVACIATWEERVLWIRRATEPQRGRWAIPSGFMEQGETPEQAAARELKEETGATVDERTMNLYLVGSLPEISEVYLVYRAQLQAPNFHTTQEADRVELLRAEDVPWDHYAYPDVAQAMHQFYKDHAQRQYGVYAARYAGGVDSFQAIIGGAA